MLPPDGQGIHLASEKLIHVATICLGVIHRGIGVLHHGFNVFAVIRIDADPDAQGDMQLLAADGVWQGEGGEQLFRHQRRILWPADFGQQDHEFVAATTLRYF